MKSLACDFKVNLGQALVPRYHYLVNVQSFDLLNGKLQVSVRTMKIYTFQDYKAFLRDHVQSLPKGGRGESLKMARYLRVHPTMLSQILAGEKDFSLEHAQKVCEYLHLDEDEARYFVLLVLWARAGSVDLRTHFEKQIQELRERSLKTEKQIKKHRKLSSEDASRFYSNWKYSATRLAVGIKDLRTVPDLARYLNVTEREVGIVLRFLMEAGLIRDKHEWFEAVDDVTFIDADSPLYSLHHLNWRVRAVESNTERRKQDYTFTSPMTLSRETFAEIRSLLLSQIKVIGEKVVESPSEMLACLNIDLFEVGR